MKEKVILLGSGGHAKVIIDILLKKNEYEIAGILDKDQKTSDIFGIPILGGDELLCKIFTDGIKNAFVALGAVGNNKPRANLFNTVKIIGFNMINVVHPTVVIGMNINMGFGNALMAGAIINPSVIIGNDCIINSGCIVEHDVIIGDHVHIAPGAKLSGNVSIGDYSHIGIGANIIQGVKVGQNVIVGAGAVVINNLPDNCTAVGVPARIIKNS
jgi:sugar O-acyltransferase (sialic acid O-acetyltransferase NeuD family)